MLGLEARNGIVSSAHYLASQAGLWMLREGGNAVDAAVCAAATIAVVAPHLNGPGGDLFAQVWPIEAASPVGLNASGRSGTNADAEHLRNLGHARMPTRGPLSVTVPGAISGWQALLGRFGTRRLYDVLPPAISYAEHGAPVTSRIARAIKTNQEMLSENEGMRSVFMPRNTALSEGELFRNPALARTLRSIGATDGAAMYSGTIAEQWLGALSGAGGLLTEPDVSTHSVEWVEPVCTTFAGRTIYELPPNTQGLTVLELLNLAEALRVEEQEWNRPEYIHVLLEAMRLAYDDRDREISDPGVVAGDVNRLASKRYAKQRLTEQSAGPSSISTAGDTVYLCVVDRNRMAVSLIQSHYMGFGSGFMDAQTGIHFQNRGAYFSLAPGHINCLAPGKRTMHTLIPAMSGVGGGLDMTFGSMGGDGQPQFQLQILLNHLCYGMDLDGAIAAPRFTFARDTELGDRVIMEGRFEPDVVRSLREGITVDVVEDYSSAMGHAQAIRWNSDTGDLEGAADPRGDGSVAGY